MGIKFYKENGKFVLGDSINDFKNAGEYEANVHQVNGVDYLQILPIGIDPFNPNYVKWDHAYNVYESKLGVPYSSIDDIFTAIDGFFNPTTSGLAKTQLVDSFGNAITLSSGEPRTLSCEYTRPANTTTRLAYGAINETVSVIKELLSPTSQQAANLNGGGGVVINGSIVSNNTSDVGRQFGIIFLREDISPIIADNAVQTILYANQGKRIMVVYATMEAQSAGSDMVIGRFNLPFEYVCKSDSKALKVLIFDVTGGTTASAAKYMVTVNVQVNK